MGKRYERIAEDLRQQISNGILRAGTQLASEEALAQIYRVGVMTVRQALGTLQAEGLVLKRHGVGNFVRVPQPRIAYTNDHTAPLITTLPIETDVSTREVEAHDHLCALLGVPDGTELTEHVCVSRHRGSTPHSIVHVYQPRTLARIGAPFGDVSTSPWGADLRERLSAAGITLDRVVEQVTARPPTADEADTFGITIGVSVLSIQRTATDTTGRVLEVTFLTLSGDRTEAVYTTTAPRTL